MDWKDLAGPLTAAGAPVLGKIIGSLVPIPGGALIGEMAGKLLAESFGVDPAAGAGAVHDAIEKEDPQVAVEKIKAAELEAAAKWPALAEKAKAEHEAETAQWQAQLADVQGARSATLDLVKAGSSISWGAPVVSVLVVLGFFAVLVLLLVRPLSLTDLSTQVLLVMLGALSAAFQQVIAYWMGSSAGSKDKDQTLGALVGQAHQALASAAAAAPGVVKKPFQLFR